MEFDGLVLSLIQIKEDDAMVRVLTNSGVISFFVRRAMSQKSTYYATIQPFVQSHFWLREGPQGGLTLRQAKIIRYTANGYEQLNQYALLELIKETLAMIADNDEWDAINSLVLATIQEGEKTEDIIKLATFYLNRLLTLMGWGLALNQCVTCGSKKDIVGVDLPRGGYVCRAHYQAPSSIALSIKQLAALLILARDDLTKLVTIDIDAADMKQLFELVIAHYDAVIGQRLKSIKLFD